MLSSPGMVIMFVIRVVNADLVSRPISLLLVCLVCRLGRLLSASVLAGLAAPLQKQMLDEAPPPAHVTCCQVTLGQRFRNDPDSSRNGKKAQRASFSPAVLSYNILSLRFSTSLERALRLCADYSVLILELYVSRC